MIQKDTNFAASGKSAGLVHLTHCYTSTRSLLQVTCVALMAENTRPFSTVLSKKEFCKAFNFLAECESSRQNTDFLNYLIAC